MEKRYRSHRLTVEEYLDGPQSLRPMELAFGVVREPPSPFYSHQALVTHLTVRLYDHVYARDLGMVCVSPIDVVLDRERALVVQPDVIFVARERLHIVERCVWGAPDLVVEVLSPATARRDRTTKVGWYDAYGVKECWLANPVSETVEVLQFGPNRRCLRFTGEECVESSVLLQWNAATRTLFTERMEIEVSRPCAALSLETLTPAGRSSSGRMAVGNPQECGLRHRAEWSSSTQCRPRALTSRRESVKLLRRGA